MFKNEKQKSDLAHGLLRADDDVRLFQKTNDKDA